eukprot:6455531-Prymnesium_polylepis.3
MPPSRAGAARRGESTARAPVADQTLDAATCTGRACLIHSSRRTRAKVRRVRFAKNRARFAKLPHR